MGLGHCIFAILQQHQVEAFNSPCPGEHLLPLPVKSVMRGFETKAGYILAVAGELEYSELFGLMTPDEDSEH